jgi:hypothetical protein
MAVCVTGAALAVARRSWFAAGCIAAIAPLDWQIGLLVCVGVFVAAIFDDAPRRAMGRCVAGGVLVAFAYVLYFALHGALGVMLAQSVVGTYQTAGELLTNPEKIGLRLLEHAGGQLWLVALSTLGMALFPLWFFRPSLRPMWGPLWVMAIFHYGLIAFWLRDFQGAGDTMLLLHNLAFFAAIALISVHHSLARLPLDGRNLKRAQLALMAVVVLLARPVFSEAEVLRTPDAPVGVRLTDQRTFAGRLEAVTRGRRLVVLGPSELLLLGNLEHESIFVYWNPAAIHEFVRTRGQVSSDPLLDLLVETDPDVIVTKSTFARPSGIPYVEKDLGQPGGYTVRVYLRSGSLE